MKFLIARLNHETNTFSPVATPLAAFEPAYDADAYTANKGLRTAMSAFIDLAEELGAAMVTPVSASANPSGTVDAAAYDALTDRIVDAATGVDAILLDLHGAMTTAHHADGEGPLLARLRAAAPGVPIAVALDLHANVTPQMVENADVMVGFKTYPHVDMYETGAHAGRLLRALLAGHARPVVRWHPLPLMAHTLKSATGSGAMRHAVETARAAEREAGVGAVSVFAGFSLADIPAPCMCVVATGDDPAATQAAADRVAAQIWAEREQFIYRSEPLAESVARAGALAAAATRPILLLDHGDNCMSGGTCDDMDVLKEALAQGLTGIAVGPLCDPQAVAQLIAAGEGATATVALGNKIPLARLGIAKAPLTLTGVVRVVSDGSYTITGPTYTGSRSHMGRTVLFDIGAARIVVTEKTQEPWDLGVFESAGCDPREARYLLLKSRMYCRPVFLPISAGFVECDSRGVTSSDYALFPFTQPRRPVFPLDPA